MSRALANARAWLERGRPERAEPELRQALAESPDDPFAHALLALTLVELDRVEDAVDEARSAITAAPTEMLGHYALAAADLARGHLADARASAREARRLEPRDADLWALSGRIELEEYDWQAALDAAEEGLAIEPEHVRASNVRTRALQQLGRSAEAEGEWQRALSRDPEDAATHTNAGWQLLERGRVDDAAGHFREALRIEPGAESATAGMLEALKARYAVYRWILAGYFWLSKQRRTTVWLVIIAVWFLPRGLRAVAEQHPALEPFVFPVIVAVVLLAWFTWVVEPMFDVTLLFHPLGRYALAPRERRRAVAVTALLALALVAGLLAWALPADAPAVADGAEGPERVPLDDAVFAAAMTCFVALVFVLPTSALTVAPRKRRRFANGVLAVLAGIAIAAVVSGWVHAFTGIESLMVIAAAATISLFIATLGVSILANRWALDPKIAD